MNRPSRSLTALAFLTSLALGCRASSTTGDANQDIAVDVQPRTVQVTPGGVTTFLSSVTGTADTSVSWTVVESAGGTIDATGRYTAPAPAGQYHVQASSHADPTKFAVATVTVTSTAVAPTLQVQGRHLLDTCGNPLFVRGPEQVLGYGMEGPNDAAGHYNGLIDQIASTGANALRILPDSSPGQPFAGWTAQAITLLDEVLAQACTTNHLVVYLSYTDANESGTNANARTNFWSKQAVKDLVNKYSRCIVVDGLQEVAYWNVTQWQTDALAAVDWFRGQGYTQPLDILSNGYGRDLPALLQYGADVVARDPLGKVILGWQAYWGGDNVYQTGFGGKQGLANPTSIANGVQVASTKPFVIQAGFDNEADAQSFCDYESGMVAAQTYGIGWLWWWGSFNGYVDNNILTNTQYWDQAHLQTPYGPVVVWTSPASIHNTSVKACAP